MFADRRMWKEELEHKVSEWGYNAGGHGEQGQRFHNVHNIIDQYHQCGDDEWNCFWQECDKRDEEYGSGTCWYEHCDNVCGEHKCDEWHAIGQNRAGNWEWIIEPCGDEEDMMWGGDDFDLEFEFVEENEDLQKAQDVFGENIMDAGEWFIQGNDSSNGSWLVNGSAYWAADLVHSTGVADIFGRIWNDSESQEAIRDVMKDAEKEYDVDLDKAENVIRNEGNNTVEDFGKMAGEGLAEDNEWFAGWFDAFAEGWEKANDDGTRDHVPNGWYSDYCWNNDRECQYYYYDVSGYFMSGSGGMRWECYNPEDKCWEGHEGH